ncbi:MAG: PAS domain S-box protein [Deltaproteobacteria bacterium]|nr:PAS domain S-box protein [Deltaproteobacteria bacterium]
MNEKITSGEALLKAREVEARVAERTDELKRANAALETEIKDLKKAEGVLHSIIEGTSSVLGEEFLRSLVRNLASTLNFRYALVGELVDEGRSVRTLALWANGSFAPDLEYPLKDTPCEHVVGKDICVYPKGVARLFPKDRLLTEMGVESYIGVPLFDAGEKPIGILVGLDDRPMEEHTARAALSVFAQRASLEMSRKKAEENLRESEKKFRNLTENIPIGISITAEDGTILEANPALWKIFGCDSKEEFQRHKIQDFYVDPAERKRFIVAVKEHGMVKDMEVRVRRKDATEFPGALTALAQPKGGGEMQLISIFQDITERKKTEAELLKAQKLESIGALAGGIAHDFNNILLGVLGNVTIAKNYLPEGDRVYSLLTEVEKAADRAKNLTRQLLTFSRGGEPVKEVAPIAALVKDSAALVLRESGTSSSFDIPDGLWMVEMDEGQMSQVINNIVLNAEQAMDGKGVIEISVENIAVTPDDGLPAAGGDYVRITVKDSGPGIPERLLNRIFDPFFTTRQKASGLGLAVSYSIVKKHNGFIQVSSAEGKGSVFQVYLPAVRKTAESVRETGKTVAAKAAGMVLVMDDEEIVRDVSGEMLNILGCKAVFAKDGEEAVELYRKALKEGRPFAAVILDLTIPGGMGGVETVRRLLDIDPDVKAIVSSGYSKDPIMSDFRKYGFSGVIAKPYRVSDFSKAVKGVLEGECTA